MGSSHVVVLPFLEIARHPLYDCVLCAARSATQETKELEFVDVVKLAKVSFDVLVARVWARTNIL